MILITRLRKAVSRGTNPELIDLARDYKQKHGISAPDYGPANLDTERSRRIADAYEGMPHTPGHWLTRSAYRQLAKELNQQYQHLLDNGYQMEPWYNEGQPYQNSQEMVDDVKSNKHLWYFPTTSGFGETDGPQDNPLLEHSGYHTPDGKPMLVNDVLRAVHDLYGHAQNGWQFGPKGEENAWREHASMFSPLATAALTTETRGQNSWVNFGKHLRRQDGSIPGPKEEGYVHPADRPYAEQKTGILPPEFWFPE